ncbi:MAG TPA: sugar ABC transporter permease [Petrotogaceae bacterium]|jgi:ABC-type sugar transport system permease subunit|nr:sugar ABC transporter permease [Petrotogaceae bacterium]HNV04714.1 sugar ABC transporter permease [Petrotogaceae bacterium]HNY38076.1 sugar ABC transporter permease [Petrotogaceae bacterium]HOG34495.1 sugar ABC transporter permease [Petrotogaceae bacterium]HPX15808.1 sugar ABC transporter permease [Petrotogaceae bacterium]
MKLTARNSAKGYFFISGWIIGFLIFTLIPIIRTFWFSFNRVRFTADGIKESFIGLLNYKNAFLMDVAFTDGLINYAGQMAVFIPVIITFSLIAAILLTKDIKGKGFFRTIFFLPVIITSGPVMKQLIEQNATSLPGISEYFSVQELANEFGLLGNLLGTVLSSFIMILWFCGVQILIFIAAIQKLDQSMYEAASIDGASGWQSFWKLTLPALMPVVGVNVLYTLVTLSGFSLNTIVQKISTDMYDINRGIGYATALSVIYFGVILIILTVFMVFINGRRKKAER